MPIFLNTIGKTNLLSPSAAGDKLFSELVDTLKGHFEPKLLVISVAAGKAQTSSTVGSRTT